MSSLIKLLDRVNRFIGTSTSILTIFLVIVIVFDVFLRYFFSITSAGSTELEWHLFSAIFLLGAGWTLQQDRHVRVDLFYQNFTDKQKATVNLIGTLVLLIPFCWIGFSESISFVQASFAVRETSPDSGGLPARYLIKAAIPIGFLLLLIQGVSLILKSVKTIISA